MAEKVICARDMLAQGVRIKTGTASEYQLTTGTGEIHVVVRDHSGNTPVPNVDYEVSGPHGVSYRGKTGAQGEVHHPEPIPIDYYELKLPGTYDTPIRIQAMPPGHEPEVQRIPGWPREEPVEVPRDVEVVLLRRRGHESTCPGCDDEIPYFQQWGAPFNKDPDNPKLTGEDKTKCRPLYKDYVPDITFWNSGCGVCSTAMLFAAARMKPFRAKVPGVESQDYNDPAAYEPAGDRLDARNFVAFMVDYCDKRYGNANERRPQPHGKEGGPKQRNLWNMFMLPTGGTIRWKKGYTTQVKGRGDVCTDPPDNPIVECLRLLVKLNTGRDYPLTYRVTGGGSPGSKIETLNQKLEAGIPVILTTLHGGGHGHFVLCVGYRRIGKKYYYYMNDPGYRSNPYDHEKRNGGLKDLAKYVLKPLDNQSKSLLFQGHNWGGGYEKIVSCYLVEGIDELFDLKPWWPGQGG